MSKQKRTGWKQLTWSGLILLMILNIVLAVWLILSLQSPGAQGASTTEPVQSTAKADLETEKLRQEIVQLQLENNDLASPWRIFSSYATLLTAIVAIAGVFATIWKQFSERQRDREQREIESRRRIDEKFSSIIADIGSDNSSLQVSATVSLMTFLRDEYEEFHEQVYLILLANLKLKHNLQVNRLLIQAFEKAIRLKVESLHKEDGSQGLDLTHTSLYRIDLSGMDLSNFDFAFAELELANLETANLFRVKGYETNFRKAQFTDAILSEARLSKANLENAHLHRTNLVASNLKETNLRGAQFFQAKLQSAHLENSDLRGARFYEADLNDAYFNGVNIDEQALKSIVNAFNWEQAHFDEDVKTKLVDLSKTT